MAFFYEAAVSAILDSITEEELASIQAKDMPSAAQLAIGRRIIETFNLRSDQPEVSTATRDEFVTRFGLLDPGDMAGLMLEEVWATVRENAFDRKAVIARLKAAHDPT